MNVYDFDKTIYHGDCSIDFYLFCLRRKPMLMSCFPRQCIAALLHYCHKINTKQFKEKFFCFLAELSNSTDLVEAFWVCHEKKINTWYLQQKQSDDIIISASPAFLLEPICEKLNVQKPIATDMDIHSAKIRGENCKGHEKVRRLLERYPEIKIHTFYSDSYSDTPMACIAQKAVLVKGTHQQSWNFD